MMSDPMQEPPYYDAIVIGSGVTGGMAAKELTEKGLRVLMLERNSDLQHPGKYVGEHVPHWKQPFGGLPNREFFKEHYSIQSKCYAFDETTRRHFIKDTDEPYVQEGNTDYQWIRGGVIGGRSLTWGRQSYRWGPQNFEENAIDGHGTDWPIRYNDLAPWYSYVEKFIGVSGQREGLESFPDMELQKPMDMYPLERRIKRRLARHAPDITFTIGRTAILTENLGDRAACHYCGPCPRGCSTGSYFSTQSSTLPAAMKTGLLTLISDTVAQKLLYDAETNRVSGVETMNVKTRLKTVYRARLVFLCASAIHSAQILLNSRNEHFPRGLANSSGVIGHYLMDHHIRSAAIGIFTDDLDKYYQGNRPNQCYIPRFRNLDQRPSEKSDFVRGYGFQTAAERVDYRFTMHKKGIGAAYKDSIRKPGLWGFSLSGFGEFLPRYENKVSVDFNKRDAYDMPRVLIDIGLGEKEHKMIDDIYLQGKRIMRAAGAAFVFQSDPDHSNFLDAIHEMGTVRMGKDRKSSALNGWNQSHDIPNLFVTDGAAMASSADVNPSLTYLAMTARAADHAAKLWKTETL